MVAIIAAILVYQLFIPPSIGMADNGDFSRIMGAVGLEYTTGNRDDRHFNYFVPTYKFESSGEWDTLVSTSENVLVLCAMAINRLGSKTGLFDVRVLGGLHLALFLLAVWMLLRLSANLGLAARVVVPLLLALVFCDVGYVAYFNSLYSEPGSFVFLFLALAAAIHLAEDPASLARMAAWLVASLLFLSAKPQNSLLGIPLAGYGFWIAYGPAGGGRRRAVAVCSVALCLGSVAHLWITPRWIAKHYLYNAVFFELLKYSPTPREDLQELGLNPDLEEYKGTNIFSEDAPVEEPEFEAAFFDRIGSARLVRFYLGHPSRLAGMVQRAAQGAFSLRPSYLGNFEKWCGLAPRAQSQAFQFWSRLKESATPRSAWFVGLFFAGNAILALAVYLRTGSRRLKAAMVLHFVVVLMAIEQFLVAEAVCGQYELAKHLFLFNLLFDLCLSADVVLATAWLGSLHFRRAMA
ncbi:MAG: hypothetical protein ABSH05_15800, partial [Bryobacteraceae bacterium]